MTTSRNQVAEIAAAIGSVLLPDNAVWTNRFEIVSKTSGHRYVIAQRKTDGVWGCGCRGWTTHRKCKHLTQVLRPLAAIASKIAEKARVAAYDAAVADMLRSAQASYRCLDIDVTEVKVAKTGRWANRALDID